MLYDDGKCYLINNLLSVAMSEYCRNLYITFSIRIYIFKLKSKRLILGLRGLPFVRGTYRNLMFI